MEIVLNEIRSQIETVSNALRVDDMKLNVKINHLDDRVKKLEKLLETLGDILWEMKHGKMGN
jgi:hypothetical protein